MDVGFHVSPCNRSLLRLLAMVGDQELHSKEYYGDVFRGTQKNYIYKKLITVQV